MKKIGVITSGGDAPGMNACLKSVVDMASNLGYTVYAFRRGYTGVINNDYVILNREDVSKIFNLGGSIIMSGRCLEFYQLSGPSKAAKVLNKLGIDTLIAIGGNGTYNGANELIKLGVKVIGIPATIDNDVYSTDESMGFDTAVNNAVQMIINIQSTMRANERVALIETMGRLAGDIALYSAMASESDILLVPEDKKTEDEILELVKDEIERGNSSPTVVLAEKQFDLNKLNKRIQDETGKECRSIILGYMQRGGSPTVNDRFLAIRYGVSAVQFISQGISNVVIGVRDDRVVTTPIADAVNLKSNFRADLYGLFKELHRMEH